MHSSRSSHQCEEWSDPDILNRALEKKMKFRNTLCKLEEDDDKIRQNLPVQQRQQRKDVVPSTEP